MALNQLQQRASILPELGERLGEAAHLRREKGEAVPVGPDDCLARLRQDNVTAAVALGILVGDAAIRDVLTNGRLGILGPKKGGR